MLVYLAGLTMARGVSLTPTICESFSLFRHSVLICLIRVLCDDALYKLARPPCELNNNRI